MLGNAGAVSSYEAARLERVKKNQEILKALGIKQQLEAPAPVAIPRKKVSKPVSDAPAKKKAKVSDEENGKSNGSEDGDKSEDGRRRSSRVSRAPTRFESLEYPDDDVTDDDDDDEEQSGTRGKRKRGSKKSTNVNVARSKTDFHGEVPGFPVGSWFSGRLEACNVGVHRRTVHGIAAGKKGATSIVLSGGYEDDADFGEAFTYTGSGGRDLKGTKANPKNLRTAGQSCDQSWENDCNAGMKISYEKGLPIRVLRGFFKKSNKGGHKESSPWAPKVGYRYDGLYKIEKLWMERGLSGFQVCKFALKRLPGQQPLVNFSGLEEDVEQ